MLDNLMKKMKEKNYYDLVKALGIAVLLIGGNEVFSLSVIMFPLVIYIGAWYFVPKKFDPKLKPFFPAIKVQIAYYFWYMIMMMASGQILNIIIRIFAMFVGLNWLINKPGRAPVYLLIALNLFWIANYAAVFTKPEVLENVLAMKLYGFYIFLSVVIIVTLVYGLVVFKKTQPSTKNNKNK